MEPWHLDDQATIYHGDCLEVLRELPDASVDSVVTDPPYALGFMGREWDSFGGVKGITDPAIRKAQQEKWGTAFGASARPAKPAEGEMLRFQLWSQEWAAECLRVLKPGGHLLAFGGTRTWHRLAVAIEDAGFEIRDSIAWMYGSGFPKSLDVSKAIDKVAGAERTDVIGWTNKGMPPGPSKAVGHGEGSEPTPITAPVTPRAREWQGWGTALKPAHEPVVVARKPLTGTVAANVLEHGTGALNIDGCRIGTEGGGTLCTNRDRLGKCRGHDNAGRSTSGATVHGPDSTSGRWPANVVLDEDQAAALDKQSGVSKSPAPYVQRSEVVGIYGAEKHHDRPSTHHGDTGGASRFFYVAKAPARERPKVDGVAHPTVKPLTLMRWLCRLVTPPGGTVLEPFAGSGTTIEAALMEGFRVVAIEREPDYLPLIAARLERVAQEPDDGQLTFDASA